MNANVAVTDPRVEPITQPRDQFISVHPRQGFLGRRFLACGAGSACAAHCVDSRGGFMEAMYWSRVGVGKSARLTVQGICTGWFERCGGRAVRGWDAGGCDSRGRLTVQGINTEWFEWHGGIG